MNKNVKIAKELVKLAKNLIALNEEGDGSGFQYYHDKENHEQEMLDLAQKQGKKYILHHKDRFGLWRIQACKDFINKSTGNKIRKGDFGGLIESEKNLSHDGSCWVAHQAQVSWDAKVYEHAYVGFNTRINDTAQIYGSAYVACNQVNGNSQIFENADVRGDIYIDCSIIHGNAKVNYSVEDKEITK